MDSRSADCSVASPRRKTPPSSSLRRWAIQRPSRLLLRSAPTSTWSSLSSVPSFSGKSSAACRAKGAGTERACKAAPGESAYLGPPPSGEGDQANHQDRRESAGAGGGCATTAAALVARTVVRARRGLTARGG